MTQQILEVVDSSVVVEELVDGVPVLPLMVVVVMAAVVMVVVILEEDKLQVKMQPII